MHAIAGLLLLAAIIAVTAVVFFIWLLVAILRGLVRLLLGPGLKQPVARIPGADPPNTRRCERDACRAINPGDARFCRRCGNRFIEPEHVAVRRAAML